MSGSLAALFGSAFVFCSLKVSSDGTRAASPGIACDSTGASIISLLAVLLVASVFTIELEILDCTAFSAGLGIGPRAAPKSPSSARAGRLKARQPISNNELLQNCLLNCTSRIAFLARAADWLPIPQHCEVFWIIANMASPAMTHSGAIETISSGRLARAAKWRCHRWW